MGLFHTTGASLPRRVAKYRPLVLVLRELVLRPDTPLVGDVKRMIAGQFDKAGVRLAVICGDLGGWHESGAGSGDHRGGRQVRGPDRTGPCGGLPVRPDFGDGDYGEGEFPLVVLTPRQYEIIRARDRG